MSRARPRRGRRNAGAFLGPDMLVPVTMRTLSDDYRDDPTEPESVPETPPEPPGLLRRVIDRLARRPGPH
jgi:hypothetical protein